MRKPFLVAVLLLSALAGTTQFTTNDTALDRRLHTYLQLNKSLDFEQLMDYTHPSYFELISREDFLKLHGLIFKMKEISFVFDSLELVQASTPFIHDGTTYRKIDFYMRMRMVFNDTSLYAEGGFKKETIIGSIEKVMPGKKIVFDETIHDLTISGMDVLFAIKDAKTPEWMFLRFDNNPQLITKLYPKEVLAHFKL